MSAVEVRCRERPGLRASEIETLGDVLAEMAIFIGCTRTFQYNYMKRKLATLDRARLDVCTGEGAV